MGITRSFLSRCGLVAAGLLLAATANATTYKWKDPATGRLVISDSPPPAGVREIGKRKGPATGPTDPANLPLATRKAMAEFPVTLFTADSCLEACADARRLLNRRGVPFTELNVREESARVRLETFGDTRLPTLLVGRQALQGLDSGRWNETLGLAGYPQEAPLGYRPPPPPSMPEPVSESVPESSSGSGNSESTPEQ
jgi:glutaredoxin